MHSSSADWVFGEARLISSPSTTLANTAPGRNSKSPRSWLNTFTPVMSVGSMSGVNWMRRNEQSIDRAIALASIVLPTPGHVLDQQMAFGDKRDQRQSDLVVLAADDPLDVVLERVELVGEGLPVARLFAKLHATSPVRSAVCRPFPGSVASHRTPAARFGSPDTCDARDRTDAMPAAGSLPGAPGEPERGWAGPDGSDAPRGPCSQLQASRRTDPHPRLHACDSSREP